MKSIQCSRLFHYDDRSHNQTVCPEVSRSYSALRGEQKAPHKQALRPDSSISQIGILVSYDYFHYHPLGHAPMNSICSRLIGACLHKLNKRSNSGEQKSSLVRIEWLELFHPISRFHEMSKYSKFQRDVILSIEHRADK